MLACVLELECAAVRAPGALNRPNLRWARRTEHCIALVCVCVGGRQRVCLQTIDPDSQGPCAQARLHVSVCVSCNLCGLPDAQHTLKSDKVSQVKFPRAIRMMSRSPRSWPNSSAARSRRHLSKRRHIRKWSARRNCKTRKCTLEQTQDEQTQPQKAEDAEEDPLRRCCRRKRQFPIDGKEGFSWMVAVAALSPRAPTKERTFRKEDAGRIF